MKPWFWRHGMKLTVVLGSLVFLFSLIIAGTPQSQAAAGDWTTYGFSNARDGYNGNETIINPTTAPNLKLKWTHPAAGAISSQPIVSGSNVYWGSWDGYEHATDLTTNAHIWSAYLGQTVGACSAAAYLPLATGKPIGVASTPTIATINGNPMLFVGGGNASFYALNPATGKVIWSRSLGSSPSHFIWSSPAVYNNSVYVGVASLNDCPLVRGQLVQMNAATGAVLNVFNVVPNGCTGGSVWGSPAVDEAAGTIYFTTGNAGGCGTAETWTESLIEVQASNLSFIHHWQVPASQHVGDGDFGSTPTLFDATINGTLHHLVGAPNKNGYYYAWDRSNINAGPVWYKIIAIGGSCPNCDQGSISASAWNGSTLYVAGGKTTINGATCLGSVRAVNPATGAFGWQHCLASGPVLGSVTAVPGLVVVGQGNAIIMMSATSGSTLFRFYDPNNAIFESAASISNGVMYMGNSDGNLYAIAP